jgi:uncharacterized MnhB-related membrane protein
VTVLIGITLALVALAGLGVVLTHDPERQAVSLSALGLALVLLFMALQAPDVALSQLGVGTALVPLMMMLTVRKLRRHK